MHTATHPSRLRPAILLGTPARFAALGFVTLLLLAALSIFTGCKSNTPAPAAQQNAASAAPQQSGQLMSDGTYAQNPAPQPSTPNPPAEAATNQAPPPPEARVVPTGTPVAVTLTETLSASHNQVGDGFTGVLARPIMVHGTEVFARGTHVRGTVVAAKGRGHFKGTGDLGIELTAIAGDHVTTSEYEKEAASRGKRSAGFIGGGAGLGAVIGAIAGGGKGAAIGALAGGGAGTAGAAYTGSRDVVLPSESTITFRLTAPIHVS
jgi:hypothetical protein